jgi:hypothetical protein
MQARRRARCGDANSLATPTNPVAKVTRRRAGLTIGSVWPSDRPALAPANASFVAVRLGTETIGKRLPLWSEGLDLSQLSIRVETGGGGSSAMSI